MVTVPSKAFVDVDIEWLSWAKGPCNSHCINQTNLHCLKHWDLGLICYGNTTQVFWLIQCILPPETSMGALSMLCVLSRVTQSNVCWSQWSWWSDLCDWSKRRPFLTCDNFKTCAWLHLSVSGIWPVGLTDVNEIQRVLILRLKINSYILQGLWL